jgi:divalent metal cation (Fe/Co/Zn/Cd) transporter
VGSHHTRGPAFWRYGEVVASSVEIELPARTRAAVEDRAVERREEWLRAARRARRLSWLSLFWMGAEGAIAITAGILAGSIALIGFGIDSAIEGVASLVIVWRFTGRRLLSHAAEERAQKLVAIQFFLLAPYVAVEAVRHLAGAEHPDVSVIGMALTATSLVGMPFLGLAKQRLANTLGSSATHGEGAQNLICAYLAGAVFLGLAGNALLGWWWLDPLAALVIAGVAVREGVETWRGEGCCAPPQLDLAAACEDDCCDYPTPG